MTELPCVGRALNKGWTMLAENGIETPGLDASLLLMKAAGLTRTELATRQNLTMTRVQAAEYEDMLQERVKRTPVAYILNTCEFMSLDFYVDCRVLIPRADTEILAEAVIARINGFGSPVRVLDIGTGSGVLAVTAAVYAPNAAITATDISHNALEVAAINAEKHGVLNRVCFLDGDLFDALPDKTEPFDIIMSNPPYIRRDEPLPDSVALYEPPQALYGGSDGLDYYRKIIANSKRFIKPRSGVILLEIGFDQCKNVWNIYEENGFSHMRIIHDFAGRDRVVEARLGGAHADF